MSSVIGVIALVPLSAQHGRPVDIPERTQGAERVVVGQVVRLDAVQQTNVYGDMLIVSHALIRVDETLKGSPAPLIVVDIEGGTINGITMSASDMPTMQAGDRAVFFVERGASGNYIPHLRGNGILKLDALGAVENTNVGLDRIRAAVREEGR